LDSDSQASVIDSVLGTIHRAWVSGGKLYGQIRFAQTPRGKLAEGMVARSEIAGISAGYSVSQWIVRDADGDLVDEDNVDWADDLTFTAVRWMLYEASLTGVPADMASAIRNVGDTINAQEGSDIRERMTIRERMQIRQAMHDKQSAIEH
jgi:phage head maturation protease